MHRVLETLQSKFPSTMVSVREDQMRGDLSVQVSAEGLSEVAKFLHDDPALAFDHITDICSADYPDDLERFEVIYHFLSLPTGTRIRVKARVPEENPSIASVSHIWKGANFLDNRIPNDIHQP